MNRYIRFIVLALVVTIGYGCAAFRPQPNPANPIKRVALLPLKNDTMDVEGPVIVREKLAEAFKFRHYNVKPLDETDQILRDRMGITLGGQLDMAGIEKLKEELGVEGLLFGTLADFSDSTTGIYNVKKVSARLKMVNAMNGQVFWQNALGVKAEKRTAGALGGLTALGANIKDVKDDIPWETIQVKQDDEGDTLFQSLAKGLGEKLIEKGLGVHLKRESKELAFRITRNLPIGPGIGAGPPLMASNPIAIPMPKIEMPKPPTFAHMDYGKKDFSAILISTSTNIDGSGQQRMEIPLAKAGDKLRTDLDMTRMTGGQGMPVELQKVVSIIRGDKKVAYTIYPGKKRYITHQEGKDSPYEKPKISRTRVGDEKIDGHPTVKYRVTISHDGFTQTGFQWEATDLDGMVIKSELTTDSVKVITELKKINLKRPAAALFEIPPGMTEAADMMELMAQ